MVYVVRIKKESDKKVGVPMQAKVVIRYPLVWSFCHHHGVFGSTARRNLVPS